MPQRPRASTWAAWIGSAALPLLPPLVAFILQSTFWPALQPYSWILFYPAVFVSTWIGGRAAGLLATAASAMLVWWFFLPYERSFTTVTSRDLLTVVVFVAMGGLFSLFHARLREATRQAALRHSGRFLLALNQAAVAVQRARTPDEIYQAVGSEAVKLGHDVVVLTLAEDREHLELSYLTLASATVQSAEKLLGVWTHGYRFPIVPGGFYQQTIAAGQTVFAARLADHMAEALPGRARPLAMPIAGTLGFIKPSIIAPLQVGGGMRGLLMFFGSGLTEADVPAVTVFANQTAIALDNLRLYQDARQQADRLATLNEIATAVAASPEFDPVHPRVTEALASLIPFERASVALFDAGSQTMTIFALRTDAAAGELERRVQVPIPAEILEVRRTGRGVVRHDLEASDDPVDRALVRKGFRSALVAPLISGGQVIGICNLGSRQPGSYGEEELALLGAVADLIAPTVASARLYAERRRLSRAVEQTSDSVIVTDLAGTIEYVNPAFEQTSGYRREEVIGQNPRILKSGHQPKQFYEAMWRHLARGEVWTGRLSNLRNDGERYEVEATISPIRSDPGEVIGYVGVQRDVTALLAARSSLATEFRERAAVAAALSRLQASESAEATAAVICDELAGLPGIDLAAIITFSRSTHATVLAVTGPDGFPLVPGRPLPEARATYLYERAELGPWSEALRARPEDGKYGEQFAGLGFRAIAHAPIRNGEGLLGVIAAGTRDDVYAAHLISHLPVIGEFAATASALLAGQLERGRREEATRQQIKAILATSAFHPVFQPIVELSSGRTVGYEALTRFDDGTRPDHAFAAAQGVDLGLELEMATLAAALGASAALPPHAWLDLNVSPDLILDPSKLPVLLAGQSRQVVLEITEHVEIADYKAVRRAVARLGPTVRLAVDDAGAGFASLRHVVELGPSFLKLDLSLVRGVDRDPTRQAMIAGLHHFATRSGCEVVAEGIEEEAERQTLRELGVTFGQGYLLGRPEPLPAVIGSAHRHVPATGGRRSGPKRSGGSGHTHDDDAVAMVPNPKTGAAPEQLIPGGQGGEMGRLIAQVWE